MPVQHRQDHATRYETLRGHALQRQPWTDRLGLAVLRLQGLAVWVTQWSTLPVPKPSPPAEQASSSDLPNDAHAEVVNVLTAMALGHLQKVPA